MERLARLIFIFCVRSVNAQPVIQNGNNLPLPGFNAARGAGSTTLPEGPAGANQIWDFSAAFLYNDGNTYQTLDPATSPFAAAFPTANYVALRTSSGSEYYFYYNNLPDRLEAVADHVSSLSGYDIFTANPKTKLKFPFAYGESVNDTYDPDGGGSFSLTITYDGYGTLITPLGTVTNAVRIKTEYTGGNTLYEWYALNPLLRVLTYGQGDLEWFGPPLTGMDEQGGAASISVSPNPLAEQGRILVEDAAMRNGLIFTLTNTMGQVVRNIPLTSTSTDLERDGLAAGVYVFHTRSNTGAVSTGRLVVE